ncbi:MAG: cytochrome c [Rhodothermia bacterium]|nr:cytochrome c [Rhodothermia bacterium]
MRFFAAFVLLPGLVLGFVLGLFSLSPEMSGSDGQAVYENRCASCHQNSGAGIPGVFPPLVGTKWVLGEPDRLISILLHGLMGELEVQGTMYNGVMPAWGPTLTDKEIAAVLTFVRSSWGNEAAAVPDSSVTRLRALLAERGKPWTPSELIEAYGPLE